MNRVTPFSRSRTISFTWKLRPNTGALSLTEVCALNRSKRVFGIEEVE